MNDTLKKYRYLLLLIPLFSLVFLLKDYVSIISDPRNSDFLGTMPASINETLQKHCIAYSTEQSHTAGQYLGAFIIGEKHLDTVCRTHYAADLLLDKTDTVAVFENIRCVLDSQTSQILGYIPY